MYPLINDVVGSTRLAHRLELLSRTVPSLKRYAELAKNAVAQSQGQSASSPGFAHVIPEYEKHAPRSFIGWAAVCGYVARSQNQDGAFREDLSRR